MSEAQAERQQPAQEQRKSGRGALWLLVPAVAGAAVGLALALTRTEDRAAAPEPSEGSPRATLVAVGAYDPEGDREEHSESVGQATDSDPATYWETETYQDFDSLKSGVGLVLEAPDGAETMTVTSSTPGFTARIDAGDDPGGPFEEVAAEQEVAESTTFELGETASRYLVVWITDLPEGVARINEVAAP